MTSHKQQLKSIEKRIGYALMKNQPRSGVLIASRKQIDMLDKGKSLVEAGLIKEDSESAGFIILPEKL